METGRLPCTEGTFTVLQNWGKSDSQDLKVRPAFRASLPALHSGVCLASFGSCPMYSPHSTEECFLEPLVASRASVQSKPAGPGEASQWASWVAPATPHVPRAVSPASLPSPLALSVPLPEHAESCPGLSLVSGLLRMDRLQPGPEVSQEGGPVGAHDTLGHRADLPHARGLLRAPRQARSQEGGACEREYF